MRLNFSDPVQLNKLNVTAAYSPDGSLPSDERFHADARYERYDWSARVRWNAGDFYDLFGPTKTSMKGYSFRVGYQKAPSLRQPRELRFEANATYYGGLDRLPDFQNIATAYDRLFAIRARLGYRNERHSPWLGRRREGARLGHRICRRPRQRQVVPEVLGHVRRRRRAADPTLLDLAPARRRLDAAGRGRAVRELLLRRLSGTTGSTTAREAVPRFLSFPGVEIDEIPGSNFGRAMLEWNLPPLRFREVGTPSFYISWMRPALFASAMVTNMDSEKGLGTDAARHVVGNVGTQLDFRIFALSRLELTLSMGRPGPSRRGGTRAPRRWSRSRS